MTMDDSNCNEKIDAEQYGVLQYHRSSKKWSTFSNVNVTEYILYKLLRLCLFYSVWVFNIIALLFNHD